MRCHELLHPPFSPLYLATQHHQQLVHTNTPTCPGLVSAATDTYQQTIIALQVSFRDTTKPIITVAGQVIGVEAVEQPGATVMLLATSSDIVTEVQQGGNMLVT
jgi:hypothetical protein